MAKEITFTLLTYSVGNETTIDETTYSNTITIGIETSDPIIKPFSEDIEVVCNQSMNGYEVDAEREKKVKEFIDKLNGVS